MHSNLYLRTSQDNRKRPTFSINRSNFYARWVILLSYLVWLKLAYCFDQAIFDGQAGSYLVGCVIRKKRADTEIECGSFCIGEALYGSANFVINKEETGFFELNDKVIKNVSENRIQNPDSAILKLLRG